MNDADNKGRAPLRAIALCIAVLLALTCAWPAFARDGDEGELTKPTLPPIANTPKPPPDPTKEPEKTPTKEPEKTPTKEPERTPVPSTPKPATPKPTKRPTPKPTKRPTPKPTRTPRPTPEDDEEPEDKPTEKPTPEITDVPEFTPAPSPSPEPSSTPSPGPITLTVGLSGEEVIELQERLRELGYFEGDVTGYFGEATEAAVKAFQLDMGLPDTGIVDEATRIALYSGILTRPGSVALTPGNTGSAVAQLQYRLMELGYFQSTLDAAFGPNLERALREYQALHGIAETGIADSQTVAALFGASPAPANVDIQLGDSGAPVLRVMLKLLEQGIAYAADDARYDAFTVAAVREYQTASALTVDGLASIEMQTLLFAPEAIRMPSAGLFAGGIGGDVLALKRQLAALGYQVHLDNDVFDGPTRYALTEFLEQPTNAPVSMISQETLYRVFGF